MCSVSCFLYLLVLSHFFHVFRLIFTCFFFSLSLPLALLKPPARYWPLPVWLWNRMLLLLILFYYLLASRAFTESTDSWWAVMASLTLGRVCVCVCGAQSVFNVHSYFQFIVYFFRSLPPYLPPSRPVFHVNRRLLVFSSSLLLFPLSLRLPMRLLLFLLSLDMKMTMLEYMHVGICVCGM